MFNFMTALCVAVSLGLQGAAARSGEKEKEIVLLAGDAAYLAQPGQERTFEGWLEYHLGTGHVGLPDNVRVFRLLTIEDGKLVQRPLHLPSKEPLLALCVGREVSVVGKAVAGTGEKSAEELWPARLTVLPASAEGRQLKVIARMPNSICNVDQSKVQPQAFLFRDPAALAKACNYVEAGGLTLEQMGTAEILRHRQAFSPEVKSIDWSKQMLLVLAAGSRMRFPIEIHRLSLNDGHLEVSWRPKGGVNTANQNLPARGFGRLEGLGQGGAETVVIPRFDGPVRVLQDGAGNAPIVIPARGEEAAPAKEKE